VWGGVRFDTGDQVVDECAYTIRAAQATARSAEHLVRVLVELVLTRTAGWSQRDVAVLVNLSHQWLSQTRRPAGPTRSLKDQSE